MKLSFTGSTSLGLSALTGSGPPGSQKCMLFMFKHNLETAIRFDSLYIIENLGQREGVAAGECYNGVALVGAGKRLKEDRRKDTREEKVKQTNW